MKNPHHTIPRVINTDKNAAYPCTVEKLKQEEVLPDNCHLRQCKYLNNAIEQDHRFIKQRDNVMLGFGSFHTAHRTLRNIETIIYAQKRINRNSGQA